MTLTFLPFYIFILQLVCNKNLLINSESNYHSSGYFLERYNYWEKICNIDKNNVVESRKDNYYMNVSNFHRQWSMKSKTLSNFIGLDKKSRLICKTIDEMLSNLASSSDSYVCSIPFYSPDAICLIMQVHFIFLPIYLCMLYIHMYVY
jgi:hypothetical protein